MGFTELCAAHTTQARCVEKQCVLRTRTFLIQNIYRFVILACLEIYVANMQNRCQNPILRTVSKQYGGDLRPQWRTA